MVDIYDNGFLLTSRIKRFTPLEIPITNLKEFIKNLLIEKLNITNELFEPQLLTSEFVEIVLYDFYGNRYSYDPKYLENKEVKVKVLGSISDSNNVFFGLSGYRGDYTDYSTVENIKNFNVFKGDNEFKFGFFDKTPRSITVVTDTSASFMQANKNQLESQRQSFIENKNIMEQNQKINYQRTVLNNENSLANLDYQSRNNIMNGIGSIVGSAMMFPIAPWASAVGIGSTLLSGYSTHSNLERLKDNQKELNNLSLEGVTLSALQAKTSYNQNLRNFNAKLKDLNYQPDSISSMGSDLSMQVGNNLDSIYIDIKIPNENALDNAYNYFKRYGTLTFTYTNFLSRYLKKREVFNYIKMQKIEIKDLNINQKHKNMIKNIFLSGVRLWNYREDIKGVFLNYDVPNEDGS